MLDFDIPDALREQLDAASERALTFLYSFFTPGMQAMTAGTGIVGSKPDGRWRHVRIDATSVRHFMIVSKNQKTRRDGVLGKNFLMSRHRMTRLLRWEAAFVT